MKRPLVYLALVFSAACYGSQQMACEAGSGPTPIPPTPTPTTRPSPTPTPSPTPIALNCKVDFLRVTGPDTLARSETGLYWLTPMQVVDGVSRQVPDPCNEPKASSVRWSIVGQSDGIYAPLTPNGFSAQVQRLAGGILIHLRVEFEGVFAVKVIQ